jgi:hypothetical protein
MLQKNDFFILVDEIGKPNRFPKPVRFSLLIAKKQTNGLLYNENRFGILIFRATDLL